MQEPQATSLHVNVPLPEVEGYIMRSLTLDDAALATELIRTAQFEEQGEPSNLTESKVIEDWTEPDFNLSHATMAAITPDHQLVALYEVWDHSEVAVSPYIWGYVHPEHRNKGLGTTLLEWAERRVQAVFNQRFADTDYQLSIRLFTVRGSALGDSARQLFEDNGYTYLRSQYNMRIVLDEAPPAPQFPEGITVYNFNEKPDVYPFAYAHRESFQDHFGVVPRPVEKYVEYWEHFQTGEQYDPEFWFLAMDGDTVAGVLFGSPKDDEVIGGGYIPTLGVLRDYRKRGLGLALLHHAFGIYYQHGITNIELGVDAESLTGATRLYERAGMHVKKVYDSYRKIVREGTEIAKE